MKKYSIVLLGVLLTATGFPQSERNANLESILADTQNDDRFVSLKYQMSWPGTGDPYFTDEGDTRRGFYSVSSIPHTRIDAGFGDNTNSLTQADLNAAYTVAPGANITAYYQVNESTQTVDVQVDMEALEDLPGGVRLYVAIFEYTTENNVKTNGETQFFHVMKKMIGGAAGNSISSMNSGETYHFEGSHTFAGSYVLPPDATDPIDHSVEHSVEEFSDLGVAVWLQRITSKEVYQATYAMMGTSGIDEETSDLHSATLYPNPANETTAIAFHTTTPQNVTIDIYNTFGQIVHTEALSAVQPGRTAIDVNTENFGEGIYLVCIRSDEGEIQKKLSIQR